MAICGQAVSGILARIDAYRPVSHVIVPIVEYFGNKMNTNDRTYLAVMGMKKKINKMLTTNQSTVCVELNYMQIVKITR